MNCLLKFENFNTVERSINNSKSYQIGVKKRLLLTNYLIKNTFYKDD
jgi:hypothetical protein